MNDNKSTQEYPKLSSISFLLQLYNIDITAIKANKILVSKGILLELHRKSLVHEDKVRMFKVLSRKGLAYGSNIRSPVHPLETQVHYCIDSFSGLADIINKEIKENA